MQPDSLRVMTFNLLTSTKRARRYPWRLRKRTVARIFAKYRPDVVGTQEANLNQLRDLAELLPDYEFTGEGNLSRSERSDSAENWYCATFYRRDRVRPAEDEGETYWFSPTPEVPASSYAFGTRPRVASWNTFERIDDGRLFVFGSTHLEAINPWHRRKSAEQIRRYIARKVDALGRDIPIFLTGDFNAVADSREIRALQDEAGRDHPLYDAWTAAGDPDPEVSNTFRGLGLLDRLGNLLLGPRRIDYVFYRPHLEVLDVRKIDFDDLVTRECSCPSDHFPVLAEFNLAG